MTAKLVTACVCVCARENAKLETKYVLKVSQRIVSYLYTYILLAESRDQKLRCKFATVRWRRRRHRRRRCSYAKFTQIGTDNCERREEAGGRER